MGERWRFSTPMAVLLLLSLCTPLLMFQIDVDASEQRSDEDPPSPPRNLDYREQAHEITLTWDPPLDWGDWSEWRGYHVYYIDNYGIKRTADTIRDPDRTSTHKMIRYGWEYFVAAETDVNISHYIGPLIPRDTIGPWVEVMNPPGVIKFNTLYNITVAVHERNTINRVILEISEDDGTPVMNRTMQFLYEDKEGAYYSLEYSLGPSNSNVSFRIVSCDGAGNWNSTTSYHLEVVEENPPVLLDDLTPLSVPEGTIFDFLVRVEDDTGISTVEILYRRDDIDDGKLILDLISLNNYSASFHVGNDIRPIIYKVRIADVWGNVFISENEKTISILDMTSPGIESFGTEGEARTGENLTFWINARDNDRLAERILIYRFDNSSEMSVNINGSSHVLLIDQGVRLINYQWLVKDRAGHETRSNDVFLAVRDVTPPVVVLHNTSEKATTGEIFEIYAEVYDNHNISGVDLYFRFGGNTTFKVNWMKENGAVYEGAFTVPIDFDGTMEYWISASDETGNMFNTSIFSREVEDNDAPSIQNIEDQSGFVGDFFEMYIVYNDNIGVSRVVWSDAPGSVDRDRLYFTPVYPIHQMVTVTVYDEAGNSRSKQFVISIDKRDEQIDHGGDSSDISSSEDDNLSVACCGSVFILVVLFSIIIAIFQNRKGAKKKESYSTSGPSSGNEAFKSSEERTPADEIMVEFIESEDSVKENDAGSDPVPGVVDEIEDGPEFDLSEFEIDEAPVMIESDPGEGPRVLSAPPGFSEE